MKLLEERIKHYADKDTEELVLTFIHTAEDNELLHINIYKTADLWEINRKDFLEVFIKGVKHGLFSMDWVVHCPYCGNLVRKFSKLNEATTEDDCTFCTTHFSNALDDNMEVVFS